MQTKKLRFAVLTALTLLAWAWAAAQKVNTEPRSRPKRSSENPAANLRVDSNLVLIQVSVCDPLNRPVTGLEQGDFRIFDNEIEQKVIQFAMDDEPIALGFVFDISGSMRGKLPRARVAAAAILRSADPEDEFFLVRFGSRARLAVPLTHNPAEIQTELEATKPRGTTALLDAIHLAIAEVKKSKLRRKALLVVSDGGDNSSRHSEREIRRLTRESDVLIYSIGIFGYRRGALPAPEEQDGPRLLAALSEQIGGRLFQVGNLAEMPDIAAKIDVELRNRYLLGFAPTSSVRDGKYHSVTVSVNPPRGLPSLHAFWRRGYFAPSD